MHEKEKVGKGKEKNMKWCETERGERGILNCKAKGKEKQKVETVKTKGFRMGFG